MLMVKWIILCNDNWLILFNKGLSSQCKINCSAQVSQSVLSQSNVNILFKLIITFIIEFDNICQYLILISIQSLPVNHWNIILLSMQYTILNEIWMKGHDLLLNCIIVYSGLKNYAIRQVSLLKYWSYILNPLF